MSDTSTTGPTPSVPGTEQSTSAPGTEPSRPIPEIRSDIERERTELRGSFERLRGELDEAVDAGRQRAVDTGKKVKKAAPVVAGALVTLLVARSLFKRRRR